jgi:Arc/MetJ-type ribon-helix-helix transcriptional regulator
MPSVKVAVSLDRQQLTALDMLVKRRVYPSRSQAIRAAVEEKLGRVSNARLAQECAKLDPVAEQTLAEEDLGTEGIAWPEY